MDEFDNCQLLLLPNEYCLAEDKNAIVDLRVRRVRFRLMGGDVHLSYFKTKIYLTNKRVSTLFCHIKRLVNLHSHVHRIPCLIYLYWSSAESGSCALP